jgi:hypothetical protein
MKRRYTVIGLIALLLVMVLTMAACGDETTDTTTAPSSTETTAAPSTDTTGAGTDTTAAPGTDTTVAAGPATGEPIKIGFLNDVTGPPLRLPPSLPKVWLWKSSMSTLRVASTAVPWKSLLLTASRMCRRLSLG